MSQRVKRKPSKLLDYEVASVTPRKQKRTSEVPCPNPDKIEEKPKVTDRRKKTKKSAVISPIQVALTSDEKPTISDQDLCRNPDEIEEKPKVTDRKKSTKKSAVISPIQVTLTSDQKPTISDQDLLTKHATNHQHTHTDVKVPNKHHGSSATSTSPIKHKSINLLDSDGEVTDLRSPSTSSKQSVHKPRSHQNPDYAEKKEKVTDQKKQPNIPSVMSTIQEATTSDEKSQINDQDLLTKNVTNRKHTHTDVKATNKHHGKNATSTSPTKHKSINLLDSDEEVTDLRSPSTSSKQSIHKPRSHLNPDYAEKKEKVTDQKKQPNIPSVMSTIQEATTSDEKPQISDQDLLTKNVTNRKHTHTDVKSTNKHHGKNATSTSPTKHKSINLLDSDEEVTDLRSPSTSSKQSIHKPRSLSKHVTTHKQRHTDVIATIKHHGTSETPTSLIKHKSFNISDSDEEITDIMSPSTNPKQSIHKQKSLKKADMKRSEISINTVTTSDEEEDINFQTRLKAEKSYMRKYVKRNLYPDGSSDSNSSHAGNDTTKVDTVELEDDIVSSDSSVNSNGSNYNEDLSDNNDESNMNENSDEELPNVEIPARLSTNRSSESNYNEDLSNENDESNINEYSDEELPNVEIQARPSTSRSSEFNYNKDLRNENDESNINEYSDEELPNVEIQARPSTSRSSGSNIDDNTDEAETFNQTEPSRRNSKPDNSKHSTDILQQCSIRNLSLNTKGIYIIAKLSKKTEIIQYSSKNSNGRRINYMLSDETGNISGVAFNDMADKFNDKLNMSEVYKISNFVTKSANKFYNTTNNNYEIIINDKSCIEHLAIDILIPATTVTYTPIEELYEKPNKALVNVQGTIEDVGEEITGTSRTGNEYSVKTVIITTNGRMNKESIDLKLWGKYSNVIQTCHLKKDIKIQNCKLDEWNSTKQLNSAACTIIIDNEVLID